MQERDLSPIPESRQAQQASSSVSGNDIDLSPSNEAGSGDAAKLWPEPVPEQRRPDSMGGVVAAVVLVGLLAVGYWTWNIGSSEKQHPNWQHVQSAMTASSDSGERLVSIDAGGASHLLDHLPVSSSQDLAADTTRDIRAALNNDDVALANDLLQESQRIPSGREEELVVSKIDATSELLQELKDGRKELFQVELFDCCDEDGDVVDVLVNGQSFATVPIMHEGTLLTIPLSRGPNSIAVQGVRDGGGGVTLALTTSDGHFFMRYLAVGEACEIGVQVQ